MATTRLPADFKEFLRLLNLSEVEYLLIGGYAVSYYGYPRPTGDLDIWIPRDPSNARKILGVLSEFGFHCSVEVLLTPNQVVRMGVPPFRIELLTTIDGVNFSDCYGERVQAVIDEIDVKLISLPRLKENKKASARFQDIADLENLP